MLTLLGSYSGWLLGLTRKLFSNSPAVMLLSVVLFLANQASLLIAFFLPLKVIILLGSPSVPKYLRWLVDDSNRDDFIIILALLSVGFYLLFLLTEIVLKRLALQSARKIELRLKKVAQFKQHNLFLEEVVIRTVRTIASYLLIGISLALIGLINGLVVLVLVIVLIVQLSILSRVIAYSFQPSKSDVKRAFLAKRPIWLNFLSSTLFFTGFAASVYSYLYQSDFNLLLGILVILLIRQTTQRGLAVINDGFFLVQNRSKIEATLYKSAVFDRGDIPEVEGHLDLFNIETRAQLLTEILKRESLRLEVDEFNWYDSGFKDIVMLKATDTKNGRDVWVRVYQDSATAAYQTESFIYKKSKLLGLRTISCLSMGSIWGLKYIVGETPPVKSISPREAKPIGNVYKLLSWQQQLDTDVKKFFELNYSTIFVRLTVKKISKAKVACNSVDDENILRLFIEGLEEVTVLLARQPLFLCNRTTQFFNLFIDNDGIPLVVSWRNTTMEPVCSDLKYEQLQKFTPLAEVAEDLRQTHNGNDFNETDLRKVILVANIDRMIQKKLYSSSILLMRQFLELD